MTNKNKIAIFLAARSGSKRLPNKHFLKINSNIRFIDICILRLKKVKLVNKIFLCTTKKNSPTMMMAAAAPPAETASKTNVFSAAKLNRSIIQDQHLSDTSIIDPLQNIIFKNGCFNDVCFKTGGQNIQFQECSLKNCQFFGQKSSKLIKKCE